MALQAVKANKVYDVAKDQVEQYAAMGYDVVDERGVVVRHAANKTVPYVRYEMALSEIDRLKKELAAERRKARAK